MGGAGALIYGAKLDARTLAFAAETRTDSPLGDVQRLMDKPYVPPHGELRPMIAQSKMCADLISGESEPVDLLSASLIGDLPQVNVISLKKAAHGPPNYPKNLADGWTACWTRFFRASRSFNSLKMATVRRENIPRRFTTPTAPTRKSARGTRNRRRDARWPFTRTRNSRPLCLEGRGFIKVAPLRPFRSFAKP